MFGRKHMSEEHDPVVAPPRQKKKEREKEKENGI
jgi:hypothetical protein